jgi:hypothetical protein
MARENRSDRVIFRATPSECETLRRVAASRGVTMSAMIRSAIDGVLGRDPATKQRTEAEA